MPTHMLTPPDAVYGEMAQDAFLQHQLRVGTIDFSRLPPRDLNSKFYEEMYANAAQALSIGLEKSGLAAGTPERATYELRATVLDVQRPDCAFKAACDTGSAIEYRLVAVGGDKVSYQNTAVVPATVPRPLFADIQPFMYQALGLALGNNFAHEIHVLSKLKKGDLK